MIKCLNDITCNKLITLLHPCQDFCGRPDLIRRPSLASTVAGYKPIKFYYV